METQVYNDVILLSGLQNVIAIDYLMTSLDEGMMFFTDALQNKIFSANLNGTGEGWQFNPARRYLRVLELTFLGPYFFFCLELALETWVKALLTHSLWVYDLGHTHSLASV